MPRKKDKYYKRPDGLYEAIRIINGKRVAFRGRTAAIVEQKMLAYKEAPPPVPLFKDVSAEWEEEHSKTLAYNTARNYSSQNKLVTEHFGNYRIDEITPSEVQAYISSFKTQARKTVTNRLLTLNLIFNYAVLHGYVKANPCVAVHIPKGLAVSHREPPTEAETKIIKAFAGKPDGLMPALILCTGCRKGEAMGLLDTDIDREGKKINISRSVYFENSHPKTKPPKSAAGVRETPVPDYLLKLLPKTQKGQPIFPGPDGKYMTAPQYKRMWHRWQKMTGLTLTAHQVRHGYATIIFEQGFAPKDIQSYLGHAQLSTTMDIYTHIRRDHREEVNKQISNVLEKL